MISSEPLAVVIAVARALETLGAPYLVGGSLASSVHGIPRTTQDADLAAILEPAHASQLTRSLEAECYIEEESVRSAIRGRRSFNVIHLKTLFKADIFVVGGRGWSGEEMLRRVFLKVGPEDTSVTLPFSSPEDTVLHKLLWYQQGGGVSDRQWQDVQGVLRVQAEALDMGYMGKWAPALGLADLLAKALEEAGLQERVGP